uniref:Ig-like domain-containing protein n=1 Tax=Cyprinodon variegatus TaxID=28743 RepID=A0A3Q2GNH4_CYPVA
CSICHHAPHLSFHSCDLSFEFCRRPPGNWSSEADLCEGQTVRLPCFSQTLGEHVESVQWDTKEKPVIKVELSSQKAEYAEGFKDRASFSDLESGDLSLILQRVQLEDQGDYFCFAQGGSMGKRRPAAWRLEVHQEQCNNKPPTTPPVSIELYHVDHRSYQAIVIVCICFVLKSIKCVLKKSELRNPPFDFIFFNKATTQNAMGFTLTPAVGGPAPLIAHELMLIESFYYPLLSTQTNFSTPGTR